MKFQLAKCIISNDCRYTHGDEGAFSVAMNELRKEYLEHIKANPESAETVKYHLTLKAER